MQQIHLNAKRCSGRGIRVKSLTPAQLDRITLSAAKMLDESGTMVELHQLSMRDGINAMIIEYTVETDLKDLATATWKKTSPQELDNSYSTLFTGKDDKIISAVYREYHMANDDEIKDIMGKALDVAE